MSQQPEKDKFYSETTQKIKKYKDEINARDIGEQKKSEVAMEDVMKKIFGKK